MRARHEIREAWIMSDDDNQTGVLLEVLLDIRELLTAEVYGSKVKPENVRYPSESDPP